MATIRALQATLVFWRMLPRFNPCAVHGRRPPLLLIGHSLGGALAILRAAQEPVDGLLRIGAVARLDDMIPWIFRPFARGRFEALGAASNVGAPWIICHDEADAVVPCSDAVRLAAIPRHDRKERVLVSRSNGGHAVDASVLLAATERLYNWIGHGSRSVMGLENKRGI